MEKFQQPVLINEICAVVTTFRPSSAFPANIQRVLPQVGLTVVVDDGGVPENVNFLSEWFGNTKNILVLHNPRNSGIAYSLDAGVKVALERGYRWALLLDDDSVIPENMTAVLLQAWHNTANRDAVAIIGADYSIQSAVSKAAVNGVPHVYSALTRITSGSLLSLAAYAALGPFNESYFIDYVDFEYCLRANSAGYTIKNVSNVGMIHPVGSELTKWGIKIRSQHSPVRQYYFFRNSTNLFIRYWYKFPAFAASVCLAQLKTLIKIIFFQEDKKIRFELIFRGISDALNGRSGKIPL